MPSTSKSFVGVSKNSRFDQGEPFSGSWRMERAQSENQPWLLAGIRQNARSVLLQQNPGLPGFLWSAGWLTPEQAKRH